jgi:hypothetical protein
MDPVFFAIRDTANQSFITGARNPRGVAVDGTSP